MFDWKDNTAVIKYMTLFLLFDNFQVSPSYFCFLPPAQISRANRKSLAVLPLPLAGHSRTQAPAPMWKPSSQPHLLTTIKAPASPLPLLSQAISDQVKSSLCSLKKSFNVQIINVLAYKWHYWSRYPNKIWGVGLIQLCGATTTGKKDFIIIITLVIIINISLIKNKEMKGEISQ